MGDALQQWVERLSRQPLPVSRDCRKALIELAGGGRYNANTLVQAIAHDPLLCVQLLRRANGGKDRAIATVQQAAVMLGANALRTTADGLPELEAQLQPEELAALRQLQRRAFHVGYLAREFVRRYNDPHYDDAYYAGLLHNLGELALRARAPKVLPQIRRLAARNGVTPAAAAVDVLGFDIPALSAALARQWHLPSLLRGVLDTQHGQDRLAELVVLAARILHDGPELLRAADSPAVLRAAELLRERPETVRSLVFRAASEASAHLRERLPMDRASCCELFPEEPQDSHESMQPAAAPAPSNAPLERLDALLAESAAPAHGVQQVLDEFIAALHDGLALDRVVVALLSADHTTLRGRFYRGVAADAPLHQFAFHRGDGSLFSRLLEKPAAVWIRPQQPVPPPMLTPPMQRLIDAREFIAQSLFVGERAVGLVYADRAISGKAFNGDAYADFRQRCRQLVAHLVRLSTR